MYVYFSLVCAINCLIKLRITQLPLFYFLKLTNSASIFFALLRLFCTNNNQTKSFQMQHEQQPKTYLLVD